MAPPKIPLIFRLSSRCKLTTIAPQDTAIVPDSGPTVASRTAMVVGGLLIKAAQRLRAQVEEVFGVPPGKDQFQELGAPVL